MRQPDTRLCAGSGSDHTTTACRRRNDGCAQGRVNGMRGFTGGHLRAIRTGGSARQVYRYAASDHTREHSGKHSAAAYPFGGGKTGGSLVLLHCCLRPGGEGHHDGLRGSIALYSRGAQRAPEICAHQRIATLKVGKERRARTAVVDPRVWASARCSDPRWELGVHRGHRGMAEAALVGIRVRDCRGRVRLVVDYHGLSSDHHHAACQCCRARMASLLSLQPLPLSPLVTLCMLLRS